MLLRVILLFLTILPISSNLQADVWNNITSVFGKSKKEETSIRVLLVHDVPKVDLEVQGRYSLYDPYAKSYLGTRFVGKRRQMQAMSDGLKWGEAFPGLYQLQIRPQPRPQEAEMVAIINNREYSGVLNIYDIGGTISIVNQVPVEKFVRSIVSGLDLRSLHPEVIAAIAIVARTNAYYQEANPKTNFWAVDAQKSGFQGTPDENQNTYRAQEAVRVTRDMVMSRTGIYEGVSTPVAAEFGPISPKQYLKDFAKSNLTLEQANEMAQQGAHAAQILAKAFPNTTIMLNQ